MSFPIIDANGNRVDLASSTDAEGMTILHYALHVDGAEASIANPIATVGHRGLVADVTKVPASVTSAELLGENESRHTWMVANDSTATMYLKYGEGATDDDWSVEIYPDGYYESTNPVYVGVVSAVWSAAVGQARVTEIE